MKKFRCCLMTCLAIVLLNLLSGCGDDDSSGKTVDQDPYLNESFAGTAVEIYDGYDYSFVNPDGTSDSDNDGNVDVNDAVIIIETFRQLGYDLPATTIQGLYDNKYSSNGYAATDADDYSDFSYTVPSEVSEEDLKNRNWDLLTVGDLIFIDHDKDYIWDMAAIYLGPYGDYDHAAFVASDYYDKAVVLDLDYEDEIINTDITYGYSAVRIPDYDTISEY